MLKLKHCNKKLRLDISSICKEWVHIINIKRLVTSNVISYAAAIISVCVGLLYTLNFQSTFSLFKAVSSVADGQGLVELWATYTIYSGISILILIFLTSIFKHHAIVKRSLQGIILLSMLITSAAQLLPLFWWILVGGADFTWQSALGFSLHLVLFLLAFINILSISNNLVPTNQQSIA